MTDIKSLIERLRRHEWCSVKEEANMMDESADALEELEKKFNAAREVAIDFLVRLDSEYGFDWDRDVLAKEIDEEIEKKLKEVGK